jgi:hypothetical protein
MKKFGSAQHIMAGHEMWVICHWFLQRKMSPVCALNSSFWAFLFFAGRMWKFLF